MSHHQCCCEVGCPACSDPTNHATDCEFTPCTIYRGSEGVPPMKASSLLAGIVSFSANQNGVIANGSVSWNHADEDVQMTWMRDRPRCYLTGSVPALSIPFPYTWNGNQMMGNIHIRATDLSLRSPIIDSSRFGYPLECNPVNRCCKDSGNIGNELGYYIRNDVTFSAPGASILSIFSRGGVVHGSGNIKWHTETHANEFCPVGGHFISVSGTMRGSCVCHVKTCILFGVSYSNDLGSVKMSGVAVSEQEVTCLAVTNGTSGTRHVGDTGCPTNRIPDFLSPFVSEQAGERLSSFLATHNGSAQSDRTSPGDFF